MTGQALPDTMKRPAEPKLPRPFEVQRVAARCNAQTHLVKVGPHVTVPAPPDNPEGAVRHQPRLGGVR